MVFSTSGRIGFRYWKKLWIRVWIGFGYWQPMSRILSGINFQFKTLGIIGFLLQILDMALLFHKSENVCNTSFVLLVCLIQISKRKNDHLCLYSLLAAKASYALCADLYSQISQELRMLSSVPINCQLTKNCHEFRFSIVRIVISVSNVTSPRIVQKSENLPKSEYLAKI